MGYVPLMDIARCLSLVDPSPIASVGELLARLETSTYEASIDRAIHAGAIADRLGYAFAGGYLAALRRLVPDLPRDARACLCATEHGGAHPRAIATRLDRGDDGVLSLSGCKNWVTLGTLARELLVVACTGTDDRGRNRLSVVRLDAGRDGVSIVEKEPLPFAPEIPHAEVTFDRVSIRPEEVLEGDGYDRYLKPFRTIEDIHVFAATLAYVAKVALHHRFPHAVTEGCFSLLFALRALDTESPASRDVHLALAGVIAAGHRLLTEAAPHWAHVDPETRARWERDVPLLGVADKARQKRAQAAFHGLEPS
jgi:hypothetical protein